MKKQMKQMKNINIIFDKKNICSYNISIATLEMLNKLNEFLNSTLQE